LHRWQWQQGGDGLNGDLVAPGGATKRADVRNNITGNIIILFITHYFISFIYHILILIYVGNIVDNIAMLARVLPRVSPHPALSTST
jgi:hypothetical protein